MQNVLNTLNKHATILQSKVHLRKITRQKILTESSKTINLKQEQIFNNKV